ncbi:uncharacterized protein BXZ73DRAFT_77600 [Epithele typhae]|uniref:uncharacterized protein n=1 Tax=Epithele typhae TaxID=378194 RepID=UPI00200786BC|nr:uncharacterized protein BXZ73DRAFT_77600 [Epithele typhae]KAH9932098.1 hypothetical protein BXZ73DRAFT_77600 [Epithele typhae]
MFGRGTVAPKLARLAASEFPLHLWAFLHEDPIQGFRDPENETSPPTSPPDSVTSSRAAFAGAAEYQRYWMRFFGYWHYLDHLKRCNKGYAAALMDPGIVLCRELALYAAAQGWDAVSGLPCPVGFDPDDMSRTLQAVEKEGPRRAERLMQAMLISDNLWVDAREFEEVKGTVEANREWLLKAAPEGELSPWVAECTQHITLY